MHRKFNSFTVALQRTQQSIYSFTRNIYDASQVQPNKIVLTNFLICNLADAYVFHDLMVEGALFHAFIDFPPWRPMPPMNDNKQPPNQKYLIASILKSYNNFTLFLLTNITKAEKY